MISFDYEDLDSAARTVWGEARGETYLGQYAIARVLVNRAIKKQQSLTMICRAPFQFSCWNLNDPNCQKLKELQPRDLAIYLVLVLNAMMGHDPTKKALHYHAKTMHPFPKWVKGKKPCFEVGNHLFYNNID